MKNEQMKRIKNGIFLILVSVIGYLFIGCDNLIDKPQDIPAAKTGYGRVAVSINGTSARTVFPTMAFAKYEYLFAKVTNGTPGAPQAQAPADGFFTLELGDWQLTVKAYAQTGDTVPAATGVSATFTVTGSAVAQVAVQLNGNTETGEGSFTYRIEYPAGAAISVFSLENLKNSNAPLITITGSGETSLSGTRSNIPSGYYFLTVQITEGGGTGRTTGANEVVYIYAKLDSEFSKVFTGDDFSHIHDWNSGYTTIVVATETMNGIGAIRCKHDPSHIKKTRCEYATGTAGLSYALIDSNTAYRVSRGTATGAIHIPAYRWYNGNYLPVTCISNGVDSSTSNAFGGTSVTSVTFAAESRLTGIANYAFYNCSSLTGIEIPAGVTSIGNYTFYNCSSLTDIEIPAGVTTIGNFAFSYCSSLTGIEIPAGVTTIGDGKYPKNNPSNKIMPQNISFVNCFLQKKAIFYQKSDISIVTKRYDLKKVDKVKNCDIITSKEGQENVIKQ